MMIGFNGHWWLIGGFCWEKLHTYARYLAGVQEDGLGAGRVSVLGQRIQLPVFLFS